MQSEQTVHHPPVLQQGFPFLQKRGYPALSDMGIERCHHVVDHPVDRLAAPGLAQVIAVAGPSHLFLGESASVDERLEEVEVAGPTGLDHRYGGHQQFHPTPRLGPDLFTDGLKRMTKHFVPLHQLARD